MRYRMLALDLDGTLLGPYGDLSPSVRAAVAAARRRGLHVVLCTGRRYRTALPMIRDLELAGPVVVNNGVVVKDATSGATLQSNYLSAETYRAVLALLADSGPPLAYVDRYHDGLDLLTERTDRAHPFQNEYLEDNLDFCQFVEDLSASELGDAIMLSRMGDEESLAALRGRVTGSLGSRIETHVLINKNYRGQILEFLAPGSGKWPALRRVAAQAGIEPAEIAAIGDDQNDVEMLRGAGLGIAMGNAVDAAKQAADEVTSSNAEGGARQAIERILAL